MSIEERKQLKEMKGHMDRVLSMQRRVDEQIELLQPEDVNRRLTEAESIVKRMYKKEQTDQLLASINST